jgi:MtN3 and saliva related transmembrane protein
VSEHFLSVLVSVLGVAAGALTTLSYLPQVKKAWPRGSTHDLSLRMLIALEAGVVLWALYGLLRGDWVIVICNLVSVGLVGSVLAFKIRDRKA